MLSDEYSKAPELCERGFQAGTREEKKKLSSVCKVADSKQACVVIEDLKRRYPDEYPGGFDKTSAPDFQFAVSPFRPNYKRIAKISSLILLAVGKGGKRMYKLFLKKKNKTKRCVSYSSQQGCRS